MRMLAWPLVLERGSRTSSIVLRRIAACLIITMVTGTMGGLEMAETVEQEVLEALASDLVTLGMEDLVAVAAMVATAFSTNISKEVQQAMAVMVAVEVLVEVASVLAMPEMEEVVVMVATAEATSEEAMQATVAAVVAAVLVAIVMGMVMLATEVMVAMEATEDHQVITMITMIITRPNQGLVIERLCRLGIKRSHTLP